MTVAPHFWVGTSWKMNKTLAEAQAFAQGLQSGEHDPRIQRFVIPPFTAVREVADQLAQTNVKVGAQNMHWDDAGAWTGEISPGMLTDCGLSMVELGHSERRAHFGETDETVGLKVAAAVRHGLIPLICIGETAAEKDAGAADDVLSAQIAGAFANLTGEQRNAPMLLAYEPVWAIGATGKPASPDYAEARHQCITATAQGLLGRRIPCLYGGSVSLENCTDLITCPHVDGLFIGRAAWDVTGYQNILAHCAKAI